MSWTGSQSVQSPTDWPGFGSAEKTKRVKLRVLPESQSSTTLECFTITVKMQQIIYAGMKHEMQGVKHLAAENRVFTAPQSSLRH